MNTECHEDDCPRASFTVTSCKCGFTERLINGDKAKIVTSANRGKGGCERYLVDPVTGLTIR